MTWSSANKLENKRRFPFAVEKLFFRKNCLNGPKQRRCNRRNRTNTIFREDMTVNEEHSIKSAIFDLKIPTNS